MKLPKIPLAQTVIKLCELKGIKHIAISPGSRNAPLTIGFTNHPFFKCYSIVDERCAAFFALGLAQQLGEPVAVVCTSGSALLNYFPAVSEAFYSDIPLVVLSADRPEYLIGIGDGQTIDQKGIFANHILYETNLKEDVDINATKEDEAIQEFNELEINKAIHIAIDQKGPVHLNIPFNEPLYDIVEEFVVQPNDFQVAKKIEEAQDFSDFIANWNLAKKKIILIGVQAPDIINEEVIAFLAQDPSVLVFTETTSNVYHNSFFPSIDKIIAPLKEEDFTELKPDLLVTMGGMIVSKKIKAFLRTYRPAKHYHIDEKKAFDTFFCLTQHIKLSINNFYSQVISELKQVPSTYQPTWNKVKIYRSKKHSEYLDTIPFSDLKVFENILASLPNNCVVQSGNSSAIRYLQLFDVKSTLRVFCNRGTSGIDGSTSTAIGAASAVKEQTVLITGDLSFFYDSNALWNNYIPSSFRIILINNGGGGIFRILPGQKNTNNFDQFFETKHNLNAKSLCEMYGFQYMSADTLSAMNKELASFYDESKSPILLEIFTPRTTNDEVLINYFKNIG